MKFERMLILRGLRAFLGCKKFFEAIKNGEKARKIKGLSKRDSNKNGVGEEWIFGLVCEWNG